MKRLRYALKLHKGSAVAMVVMIMAIIMVITSVVAILFSANRTQASHQEDYMKAYYLANSGIEIGYAALLTDLDAGSNINYYYQQYASQLVTPQTSTQTLTAGTVVIRLFSQTIDGKTWLVIESTGQLTGTTITQTLNYRFRADNPAVIIRD